MEIRRVSRPSREEWDWIWRGCPWATAFQSPDWAALFARVPAAGLRPRPRRIEFEDGAVAILPLSTTRHAGGLLLRQGMPLGGFGGFGGWIARMPIGRAHVGALAERLRGGVGELDFRLNPYTPHLDHPDLPRTGWEETRAVALGAGFDAVFRGWSENHQSAVRQAERDGVRVTCARGAGEWGAYHEIHQRARVRGQAAGAGRSPELGWPLFAELARRDSRDVRLWLARVDEQVVAGAVCLYSRHHVSCWHGALDERFATKRPAHLVVHRAMRDAAERGFEGFEFNPSHGGTAGGDVGLPGAADPDALAYFERGFGARALRVPVLRHHTRRARMAARTRRWLERAGARA